MRFNPLDWSGEVFLNFYALVALLAGFACFALRWDLRSASPRATGNALTLSPLQLAYLKGGRARTVLTAMIGLFSTRQATLNSGGDLVTIEPGARRASAELAQFTRGLRITTMTRKMFARQLRPGVENIRGALEHHGLVPAEADVRTYRWLVVGIMSVPLVLGIAKVFVGHGRGKPTGYLVLLLVITVIAMLQLLQRPWTTRIGAETLARKARENARAARAPREHELMLAVALGGAAVLSGTDYDVLYRKPGSDGSGGCGGGGAGGDGGSGCGGGGCGGCGG